MMDQRDWLWMPHPAHFCLAEKCRFHLATYVNGYIVSTVGELVPGETWMDVIIKHRNIDMSDAQGEAREREFLAKVGYQPLGYSMDGEDTYETMVFKAVPCEMDDEKKCCPYRIVVSEDQEMNRYKEAGDARKGHLELCHKYAAL